MRVGDVLCAVSKAGLKLEAVETADILKAYPADRLTPQLVAAIREHKADIMKIIREDEEMHRTGIVQSERQVFDLARLFFGLNEREGVE